VSLTAGSGFYADQVTLRSLVFQVVLTVMLGLMLFAGAYNKKTAPIAAGVFVLAGFLLMILGRPGATNTFLSGLSDLYPLYFLPVLAGLAVFLLTRTRMGTVALLVAGMLVLVLLQLLYEQEQLALFLLFVVAASTLFVYKGYQQNQQGTQGTETAKSVFVRTFLVSSLLAVLMVALCLGAFRAVIEPLDLSTRELALATKQLVLQAQQKGGMSDGRMTPEEEEASELEEEERLREEEAEAERRAKQQRERAELLSLLGRGYRAVLSALRYLASGYRWALALGLMATGMLGAVSVKLWSRKRWLKKLSTQSRDAQVRALYLLYLRKLKVLGIERRPEETLFQFAEKAKQPLSRFSAEGLSAGCLSTPEDSIDASPSTSERPSAEKIGFVELTDTFVSVSYGGIEVAQDELNRWLAFHEAFYKNCKAHLGGFKYVVRFFAL